MEPGCPILIQRTVYLGTKLQTLNHVVGSLYVFYVHLGESTFPQPLTLRNYKSKLEEFTEAHEGFGWGKLMVHWLGFVVSEITDFLLPKGPKTQIIGISVPNKPSNPKIFGSLDP